MLLDCHNVDTRDVRNSKFQIEFRIMGQNSIRFEQFLLIRKVRTSNMFFINSNFFP